MHGVAPRRTATASSRNLSRARSSSRQFATRSTRAPCELYRAVLSPSPSPSPSPRLDLLLAPRARRGDVVAVELAPPHIDLDGNVRRHHVRREVDLDLAEPDVAAHERIDRLVHRFLQREVQRDVSRARHARLLARRQDAALDRLPRRLRALEI